MILALAGRRVDKEDQAEVRFPSSPESVSSVSRRVRGFLEANGIDVLVCSAACGADLIALREARLLGLRRRVVLASDPVSFRTGSVTDRPGDWGPMFDQVIRDAEQANDLLIADPQPDVSPYLHTNHVLVEEALRIAAERGTTAAAVQVWDGKSRGSGDATEEFGEYARSRGLAVETILTV